MILNLLPDRTPSILDGSAVAELNPLDADEIYQRLPEMNRNADVAEIAKAVRSIIPSTERIARMDMNAMCASTRDLGILLGSIRRHGVEPIEVVPQVEAPLLLMALTTEMVPRETLFHTSVWNPKGPRQRMFTGDHNEDVLLEATRMGAICVERMLQVLIELFEIPFEAPEFPAKCATLEEEAAAMVEAVDYTRKNMNPVFFAQVQRPYYEQILLGGKRYSGAAAAALSIGVVDHLLWASDSPDPAYRHFQNETIQYTKNRWKQLYHDTVGQPSMISRLRARLATEPTNEDLKRACHGMYLVLRAMLRFRGRHRLLAQSAYDAAVRLYEVGSAGFGIDTLELVLTLTHESSRVIETPNRGHE